MSRYYTFLLNFLHEEFKVLLEYLNNNLFEFETTFLNLKKCWTLNLIKSWKVSSIFLTSHISFYPFYHLTNWKRVLWVIKDMLLLTALLRTTWFQVNKPVPWHQSIKTLVCLDISEGDVSEAVCPVNKKGCQGC